ncbi:MAG TPA: efflux transporter periplasmic adaptor subunit, partial [Cupriavidus sp.]|nr:efflux transporter periplasmic adaptor subunit [Cupriavidus sp.]
ASVAIVDQNGKVAIQKIQLGRDFGSHVEVLGGLAANARVIVNPGDGLVGGARVRVSSPQMVASQGV